MGTEWGRVLAVQVALVLAMLGLAATNRYRLMPRLEPVETRDRALAALRRTVLTEQA